MRLEAIFKGMKAVSLYDNGLKTGGLAVYEVLKVGRAKVKVREEYGSEGWLYPCALDREITEERYAELMEETHGRNWRERFASGDEPDRPAAGNGPKP